MMILNVTKKTILAGQALCAEKFGMRLRGMIGRDFAGFDAMLFPRCGSVHTFFMSIPLDLVFVSADNHVLKTVSAAAPWRPLFCAADACSVIELPSGALQRSGTEAGDQLDLNAVMTDDEQRKWKQIYRRNEVSAAFPLGEK